MIVADCQYPGRQRAAVDISCRNSTDELGEPDERSRILGAIPEKRT